jgi:hypothetical protein
MLSLAQRGLIGGFLGRLGMTQGISIANSTWDSQEIRHRCFDDEEEEEELRA